MPPTPPGRDPTPRTARNALIVAMLLMAGLALGAQFFSSGFTARPGMEPYVKAGPRSGAEQLERDLLSAHPPGSNLGPLAERLRGYGFDCQPVRQPGLAETCRFRVRRGENQVLTANVDLGHDGLVVQTIGVHMTISAN